MSWTPETSAAVFSHSSPDWVQAVTREITKLPRVDPVVRERVNATLAYKMMGELTPHWKESYEEQVRREPARAANILQVYYSDAHSNWAKSTWQPEHSLNDQQKAAVLLSTLPVEELNRVFSDLSLKDVHSIKLEAVRLPAISLRVRERVLREFIGAEQATLTIRRFRRSSVRSREIANSERGLKPPYRFVGLFLTAMSLLTLVTYLWSGLPKRVDWRILPQEAVLRSTFDANIRLRQGP